MGSWNHKEIVALLNILGPDMVEKQSLDSLCNRLHQAFNKSAQGQKGTICSESRNYGHFGTWTYIFNIFYAIV